MKKVTYKDSGVDIDSARLFIESIKPLVAKTGRKEVLGKIGGFSGFFKPELKKIKNPVLVSSTDGVGTKLMLADLQGKYDTIGIDLVAMCADDVVVTGAEPLFFLDYVACGRLDREKLYEVMKGIVKGCQKAGCALLGGETAELPGMYARKSFDLAGFCVGIVAKERIIDGRKIRKGDKVLGLASSGVHSNGFSLIRKIFSEDDLKGKLGREFLKPTRIYTPSLLEVMKESELKGLAHITGGGFFDNIYRILPHGTGVRIDKNSWPLPLLFRRIQERGKIDEEEMFRTFNMGVGMIVVVSPQEVEKVMRLFSRRGEKTWLIGEIISGKKEVVIA